MVTETQLNVDETLAEEDAVLKRCEVNKLRIFAAPPELRWASWLLLRIMSSLPGLSVSFRFQLMDCSFVMLFAQ